MTEQQKTKTFGIKLYQHEIDEFKRVVGEMNDGTTDRDAFLAFMDFYVNPPKKIQVDNPELVKKIEELQKEQEALNTRLEEKIHINVDLENELKIFKEGLNKPENHLEVEVHPVAFEFLKKMAAYQTKVKGFEVTPGDILVNLFLCDLQNPRANNLPYIVPTSEIRAKLEEYKKQHPEEYEHKR